MIQENLSGIERRIRAACERSGRAREAVKLILVSKTVSVERILEAYGLGIRDFGENRIQEWVQKKELLPKDIRWHLIGHLQTNKTKFCDSGIHLIHSLDSDRLARELDKIGRKNRQVYQCLIQVNASGEFSKFGVAPSATEAFVSVIARECENVKICGLMTIGPLTDETEKIRTSFKLLGNLQAEMKKKFPNYEWNYLSMGMSSDFEIAIEEGANLLRIGTAVFGERVK